MMILPAWIGILQTLICSEANRSDCGQSLSPGTVSSFTHCHDYLTPRLPAKSNLRGESLVRRSLQLIGKAWTEVLGKPTPGTQN